MRKPLLRSSFVSSGNQRSRLYDTHESANEAADIFLGRMSYFEGSLVYHATCEKSLLRLKLLCIK